MHIFPNAYFLTAFSASQMLHVHVGIIGFKVQGIVRHVQSPVYALHHIFRLCYLKQFDEHWHGGDILGVDAVHQSHRLHLAERDGLVCVKHFKHCFFYCYSDNYVIVLGLECKDTIIFFNIFCFLLLFIFFIF